MELCFVEQICYTRIEIWNEKAYNSFVVVYRTGNNGTLMNAKCINVLKQFAHLHSIWSVCSQSTDKKRIKGNCKKNLKNIYYTPIKTLSTFWHCQSFHFMCERLKRPFSKRFKIIDVMFFGGDEVFLLFPYIIQSFLWLLSTER